jgi:hypothetical protein
MISFKAPRIEIIAINEGSQGPQIHFTTPPKRLISSRHSVEVKSLNEMPTIQFTPFLFENAHSGSFSSAKSNVAMRISNAQGCKTQIKQTNKVFEIKATNEVPTISFKTQIKQTNKVFEIKALNEAPTISFKIPSKKQNICDNDNNKISIEITYNQKTEDPERENQANYLSKLEFFIKDEIMKKIIDPYHKNKYDKVKHYINGGSFQKHLDCFKKTTCKSDAILYLIKQVTLLIKEGIDNNEEIIELNELVAELNQKIKNLEKQVDKKKTYDLNIKTNLDVKITLKDKYFIYIAKFGLPKNGIFDMKKLEEC